MGFEACSLRPSMLLTVGSMHEIKKDQEPLTFEAEPLHSGWMGKWTLNEDVSFPFEYWDFPASSRESAITGGFFQIVFGDFHPKF